MPPFKETTKIVGFPWAETIKIPSFDLKKIILFNLLNLFLARIFRFYLNTKAVVSNCESFTQEESVDYQRWSKGAS